MTASLLVSCGGGGGGGGGQALVTFDTTTVDLGSRYEDGPATLGQDIHMTVDTSRIVDFYIEAVSAESPAWLSISLAGSGDRFALTFVAATTAPVGKHNVILRLVGLNATGQKVAAQVITIIHEVLPRLRATAASPLNFDFVTLAPTVAAKPISIAGTGLDWTITTGGSLFQLSSSSGTGAATVFVQPTTVLPPGTYNDTITVASSNGQTVQLPVTAVVRPPSFVVTPTSVAFNAINGALIASQNVAFSLDNNEVVTWSASSSAAWLGISPLSGTTPGSITLSVDPAQGPLASGSHAATANLSAAGVTSKSIPVALTLATPTLTAPASLTLGGSNGRDIGSRDLTLSLNTGSVAWPWTLTSKPAWVSASTTSGTVNADGTTLSLAPVPSEASTGINSGTLVFTATVNGDTVTRNVSVTLNLDQHRLLVSTTGVALTSTPAWSRLTRQVTVTDNLGLQTPWTATASEPWLTVTPAGTTGASGTVLQLQADVSGLPVDTVSYATVTVSASDSSIAGPETVQVAVWKGSSTPAAMVKLAKGYNQIKADPIRPYVYAHANGSSIDVYNVYTGGAVATISNLGAALGDMVVSGDGKWLYVTDTTTAKMVVVDLATQAKSTSWSLTGTASASTHLEWLRNNGADLLLLGNGTAYLATSGTYLKNTGIGGVITASANGRQVFTINEGLSPATMAKYSLDYSSVISGSLAITSNGTGYAGSNGRDIAVSYDGSVLFTASGSPYVCRRYDATTFTYTGDMPEGEHYPDNAETAIDGRSACGLFSWYGTYDLWIYDADGVVQSRHRLAGYARVIKPRQLVFSGDAMMVVGQTDDPYLVLVPLGP